MTLSLHLLLSDAAPAIEGESEVILIEEEADEEEAAEVPPDRYSFVTTLVSNYEDLAELRIDVAEWWHDLSGVRPALELLSTDPLLMSRDQRDSLEALEPDSWSIRNPLVAYRRDSPEGQAEARRFVVESALALQ